MVEEIDRAGFQRILGTDDEQADAAAEVTGILQIPEAGLYKITVTSDDGFWLSFGNPPTDAAGAYIDSFTLARLRECGLDPEPFLTRNDAYLRRGDREI